MLGPFIVILVVAVIVMVLIGTSGGRSRRNGGSTAGHYDPNAIGGYTLDPATMRYRYDLPTIPPGASPAEPGNGPPDHRRRRRRRPGAGSG